jgi:uroporphyrinogen decarboxylase
MNGKERFLLAADHEKTDRIPMDIGNYYPEGLVSQRLMEATGEKTVEGVYRYLGIDRRAVIPEYIKPRRYTESGAEIGIWGIPNSENSFLPSDDKILTNAESIDEVESYAWPSADWYDFESIGKQCDAYSEYAVSGGFWGSLRSKVDMLLGMQNAMIALYEKPHIVKAIVKKVGDFFYEANTRFFEAAEGKIDIFMTAEDLGTQNSVLMSVDMFREFYFDQHKRLIDLAKKHVKKIMFHSCGSVVSYIPMLMELGVDILNPIQVRASGMDPGYLKNTYGNKICFHGGVDTQFTLPYGSEEDVRKEVRDRIRIMGENGGYILAPSQDFLSDIPVCNIIAMYDEGRKYRL